MQTQTQNTDIETNTINNATINANAAANTEATTAIIANRLARIPHIIKLPPEPPSAPELQRLLESRIAEIEAEQLRLDRRDEDQAFEHGANKCILSILRLHLDDLRQTIPQSKPKPTNPTPPLPSTNEKNPNAPTITISPIIPIPPTTPPTSNNPQSSPTATNNNCADLTEPTEPNVGNQRHQTEPQVSRTEPGSPPSEPAEPENSASEPPTQKTDAASMDKKFKSELKKIPVEYHEIAADLYESLHHRSKFSKLTSEERQSIYELCKNDDHMLEDILEIISKPPPIGMDFQTSLAGLKRFCADYERILFDKQKLEAHQRNEQSRLIAEQSFEAANASDETFRQTAERQIRKRLFNVANDPQSNYQEIRWLLKSLEFLRKPQPETPN